MTSGRSPRGSRRRNAAVTKEPVVICGVGGHGRVVADVATRSGLYEVSGFLDDREQLVGTLVNGYPVLGTISRDLERIDRSRKVLIGIGSNQVRRALAARIDELGFRPATAVDPSAQIGSDVVIGPGTVVMPNVVVNTGARIGAHVILNTSASVDHDCVVEDFAHVCPGVHLAGAVTVGEGAMIGVGSSAIPGARIGRWSTVGAGSTVIRNIPDGVTAFGTPARPVSGLEPH